MAHVTGTASNLRDTLEQIRTFLKSNATLAAASPAQTWTELRYIADNVETADTNMTLGADKNIQQMLCTEPRFAFDDLDTSATPTTTFSNFVGGTSFIRWKLRTAKAVTKLAIRTHHTTPTSSNLRTFRLQYSDDGSSWTTVQTFTNVTWTILEEKEFSGWAATGAHLWWRILIDTNGTGGTTGSIFIRRLLCYDGAEIVNSSCAETYLKGPGLAGTDEIFIGLRTITEPIKSWYLLQVMGFTGFLSTELSCYLQPGCIGVAAGAPFLALWDNPMGYWITGSGRRVIFTFKVSTVYEAGYAGFILPYATAAQYPYPLAIGGSMSPGFSYSTGFKYDLVAAGHSAFCMPGTSSNTDSTSSTLTYNATLWLLQPSGVWEPYANRPSSGVNSESFVKLARHCVIPHTWMGGSAGQQPVHDNIGGGYLLMPHILFNHRPIPSRYIGELDGTRQVSGQNNAAENTGTFASKPYVVFQNTYRTAKPEYWAMLAE